VRAAGPHVHTLTLLRGARGPRHLRWGFQKSVLCLCLAGLDTKKKKPFLRVSTRGVPIPRTELVHVSLPGLPWAQTCAHMLSCCKVSLQHPGMQTVCDPQVELVRNTPVPTCPGNPPSTERVFLRVFQILSPLTRPSDDPLFTPLLALLDFHIVRRCGAKTIYVLCQ
jgi:hypothetical protein